MSWSEKIRALQSLAVDIPDDRIELMGELSEVMARKYLGEAAYSMFILDPRLEYDVCAHAISQLILSSRAINESSSIHSTSGFGAGEIHPSQVNEMINLSKRWEFLANQALSQLRAEIPAECGWIDI